MGFFDRVCQPSQIDQRHVVIIGGGYGGMELASLLMKWNVPFTLIDPKEYFHHNVGALRAVVDESKNILIYTFKIHILCLSYR